MAIESNMKDPSFGANNIYTVRQKKGTTFLLQINLLICNVIWQNLVLLSLVNIIVDVPYLIFWIYPNFCRLLCKKCDVGYYVINHGVMKLMITG